MWTKLLLGLGLSLVCLTLALAEQQPSGNIVVQPTSNPIYAFPLGVSASAASNKVLKTGKGNFYSGYATNLTATAGFVVLLDASVLPSDGAITPIGCVPLPANGNNYINLMPGEVSFTTGLVMAVTSANTCFTLTTGVITAFFSGVFQ